MSPCKSGGFSFVGRLGVAGGDSQLVLGRLVLPSP